MKTEIVKIDPKEYGLEVSQVATIEQAFLPKIQEREALAQMYEQLITTEITPELCVKAGETRKKLVKVRTGIAEIHKTQKAFFLAAGRFVDAWKSKETLPVEQMEENLSAIENHYINIEKVRKLTLAADRLAEVSQYTDHPASALGEMEDAVYVAYLQGLKVAYDAKIEAEKKAENQRIEAEKIAQLNDVRKAKTTRLVEYIDNYEAVNFGEMSEEQFTLIVNSAIEKRTAKEAEIEAQRLENERLKAEAEAKEKQLAAERARVEAVAKKEREEAERKLKEEQEAARIAAEIAAAEKAKLEAEIQAQKDAEAKRIADEKAAKEAELNKGDSEKVNDLIKDLTEIKSKYSFKSVKNQKMYSDVATLLDKVIEHVKK